jgi:hypothetical protein
VGHVLAQGPWEIVSFPAIAERRSMIVAGARSLADGHNVGLTMWATIPLFSETRSGIGRLLYGCAALLAGVSGRANASASALIFPPCTHTPLLLAFRLGHGAVGLWWGLTRAPGRYDPVDSMAPTDRATTHPGSGGSRIAVA